MSQTLSSSERMKAEWDARARENAYHFIASGQEEWTEEEFAASGRDTVRGVVEEDLESIAGARDPKSMTVLEIGCGAGRMTQPLADLFGHVHAVDVSDEMIARAKKRLSGVENVSLYATNGVDLSALGEAQLDFALSFVVFQHIPSLEVVQSYIAEVGRRLAPGALFKFQAQGDPRIEATPRDSWHGVRFSAMAAIRAARESDMVIERFEGVGEQYFWLWLRKSPGRPVALQPVEADLLEAEHEILNQRLAEFGNDLIDLRWWHSQAKPRLDALRAHFQSRTMLGPSKKDLAPESEW